MGFKNYMLKNVLNEIKWKKCENMQIMKHLVLKTSDRAGLFTKRTHITVIS